MTNKLTLYVPRLVASLEDRKLSGLLLPFGEPGRTNLGRLTASADSKLDVAPTVTLNVQHDRKRPIGKALDLESAAEGLRASFHVVETRDGDDALLEAAEGLRCGLSVEIEPIVVRDGRIVSGTIVAAGLVTEPAFPSARLAAEDATVVPDMGDGAAELPDVVLNGTELEAVTAVEVTPEQITITTQAPEAEPQTTLAASAQPEGTNPMTNTAPVVQNAALVADQQAKPNDTNALFASLVNAFSDGVTGKRLEAALADVVPGNILGVERPQYEGQVWAGVPFERRVIPTFDHGDLTSFSIKGWDWGTAPVVDLYSGNKTAIPSAAISTVETSGVIQRIAGGHDIDRKFRDFGNAEFWAAYFAKMAESYAKVSDSYITAQIAALPTAGNGGRVHLLTGNAPAGVPTALWQIIEGCAQILTNLNVVPTHAFVTVDYWKPLLYTKMQDVLAYLDAALSLKDGTLAGGGFKIIPVAAGTLTSGAWVGKTLVAHKSAVKVYELPGSPIRIEAEAIANAGVDEALFGYVGYMTENVKGLVSFDAPAAT